MASKAQLAWLASMAPAAQAAMKQYGVPASVTLAQAILESDWGQSELTQKAKNFFGIKAEHINLPNTYMELLTTEYICGVKKLVLAGFEKYSDAEACFTDHAQLLHDAARYQPAMRVAKSPDDFAKMLRVCGYSTLLPMNAYSDRLITLIREFNLYQYDTPLPLPPAAEKKAA
jgi:flagellum-specific peptidoglycan hydrolase FlgJ